MKICPYCESELPDNTIKCKYCWELVDDNKESGEKNIQDKHHNNSKRSRILAFLIDLLTYLTWIWTLFEIIFVFFGTTIWRKIIWINLESKNYLLKILRIFYPIIIWTTYIICFLNKIIPEFDNVVIIFITISIIWIIISIIDLFFETPTILDKIFKTEQDTKNNKNDKKIIKILTIIVLLLFNIYINLFTNLWFINTDKLNWVYYEYYENWNVRIESNYKDNKLEWQSIEYYPDWRTIKTVSNFKSNKQDWITTIYDEKWHKKIESNFKEGELEWKTTEYFSDWKTVARINIYKNNVLDWRTVNYYENWKIRGEENYINGILNWEVFNYFDNWKLKLKCFYKDGELEWELYAFNENWTINHKRTYKNWKLNWEYIMYFENWNISSIWNYVNDEANWEFKEYYENWTIKIKRNAKNNKLNWTYIEYDENWKIVLQETYVDDELINTEIKSEEKEIEEHIFWKGGHRWMTIDETKSLFSLDDYQINEAWNYPYYWISFTLRWGEQLLFFYNYDNEYRLFSLSEKHVYIEDEYQNKKNKLNNTYGWIAKNSCKTCEEIKYNKWNTSVYLTKEYDSNNNVINYITKYESDKIKRIIQENKSLKESEETNTSVYNE